MDQETAKQQLEGAELAAVLEGQLAWAQQMERSLLEQDIPVRLAPKPEGECCSGGCGCGSKLLVVIRRADIPRVQQLLQQEWLESVRREGLGGEGHLVPLRAEEPAAEGEPACPACGCTAPLVEGACSDCGLQLE